MPSLPYRWAMELNHLKYFYTVAREGSFTRASVSLRVQQPTISKMVRHLESQLGLVLIERHKKGIRLTKSGVEIYRTCEDIFDRVEEIRSLSDREKSECSGPLSFGGTDSVASYLVPKILGDFMKSHPKVRPSIFAGSSNLICNEILDGKVEFGLFFTGPDQGDFQVSELVKVPFQLVISTDQLKRKDLRSAFVISREIDYPKHRPFPVLEMLKRHKIDVDPVISSNNLDAQKQMVKEGLGVALLPGFMVKSGLQKGTLTSLQPKREFSYSLKLVTRTRKVLSKNAATFLDVFKQSVQELI